MRGSNQAARTQGVRARSRSILTVLLAVALSACTSTVASPNPSPTTAPTPVITPDPHLTEPATADAIFNAIRKAGLPLSVTNANGGDPNSPVVKRINAAIDNWPLVITEYRTSALLKSTTNWDPAKLPDDASPAYAFVGLNVMIAFGPASGKVADPAPNRQEQAQRLVDVLDPLLWPLQQRSLKPIPTRPADSASASPKASPKPSPKP
jgi:hypothetical protein